MRREMMAAAFLAAVLATACTAGSEDTSLLTSTSSPIIGGTAVTNGDWPEVGAISIGDAGMCTGTLISPKVVATAAHCIKGGTPTKFTLGYDMDDGTDYAISKAIYHPDYDEGDWNSPGEHDVGVIVLKKAVQGVTPARLFSGNFSGYDGDDIVFVGYGTRDSYGAKYGQKYKVTLTIEDIDSQGFWNYTSSYNTKNTCSGDSGGPGFVKNVNGEYMIGGFVSSGDQYCVENGYNMRADTNSVWLLQQVATYDPDGGTVTTPECGNGVCESGETSSTCSADCPTMTPCGNGVCESGESLASCPSDCKSAAGDIWTDCSMGQGCPNGQICVGVEADEAYCTITCTDITLGGGCGYQDMACLELSSGGGACIRTGATCGDGYCWFGETAAGCPADCDHECGVMDYEGCCLGSGALAYCDNGQVRTYGCPAGSACTWVTDTYGESYYWCMEGTATDGDPSGNHAWSCEGTFSLDDCGNGACDEGESTESCPADCPAAPICGNGMCDGDENCTACPGDCGACAIEESPTAEENPTAEATQTAEEPIDAATDSDGSGCAAGTRPASPLPFLLLLVGLPAVRRFATSRSRAQG